MATKQEGVINANEEICVDSPLEGEEEEEIICEDDVRPRPTLDELLEMSGIKFETIKGTSRKAGVCEQLTKRNKVRCTPEDIEEWVKEWEAKLKNSVPEKKGKVPTTASSSQEAADHRKVFVGGLPLDADEAQLRSVFSPFGKITCIDIKKDSKNGRSRGFAFVVFSSAEEAAAAAEQLMVRIGGKRAEVHLALPTGDPSLLLPRGPDPSCKIFVGGLTQDCTEQHLADYFSSFGSITCAEVKRDHSNGRSRGFGFVTFHSAQAALDALETPNIEICGKCVEVLHSMMRGDPKLTTQQRGPDPRCKVFVGGLPQSADETTLQQLFESFGTVIHAEVKRDFSNDRSRGFGFVVFQSDKAAAEALNAKSLMIEGKQVDVQATLKKGDPLLTSRTSTSPPAPVNDLGSQAKIFVGGLSQDVTADDLQSAFSIFGSVASAEVKKDTANGRSRGFGFVTFTHATSAVMALQNPYPNIKGRRVEIKAPVSTAQPAAVSPAEGDRKVFVGGLPAGTSKDDVLRALSPFGPVENVDMKSKGYAFATFQYLVGAEQALVAPRGSVIIGGRPVEVKVPSRPQQQGGCTAGTNPSGFLFPIKQSAQPQQQPGVLYPVQQPQQQHFPQETSNPVTITDINAFLNFASFNGTQQTAGVQPPVALPQQPLHDLYRLLPIASSGMA